MLALPEVGLPAAWPPFSRSISFCISLIFDVRPGIFVSILESVGTHSTGQAMLTSGLPKNAQQLQPPIPDKRGGGGGGGTSFFSKAGRRGAILLSLSAWDASKGGGGGHHDYDMFFEAGAGPHYCF